MESNTCLDRSTDRDLRDFIIAVMAVEVFLAVFFIENKVYDLSTAMIFAFSLGMLARGKFGGFYMLYPVGCLNRETMFLLSLFFAAHYFWKMEVIRYSLGLAYQGSVFFGFRMMIMKIFEGNPGQTVYFQAWTVVERYLQHPLTSLGLAVLVAATWFFVARRWREKPAFLRSALVVLLPLQVFLHLALGAPYEIRVFAEIFPVLWALMFIRKSDIPS